MGKNWNEQEDKILKDLVHTYGKQWGVIAQKMGTRTSSQVAARWEKCLDPKLTKGPFSTEEDAIITEYVSKNGPHNWPGLSQLMKNRSPKQCRERWFNHLDPKISSYPWTPNEDALIFDCTLKYGKKWAIISKFVPGRTDNAIKNRWNSSISKRVRIDQNGRKFLAPDLSRRQKSLIPQQLPKQNFPVEHGNFPFQPPPISTESSTSIIKDNFPQNGASVSMAPEQIYSKAPLPFSTQNSTAQLINIKNNSITANSSYPFSIPPNSQKQLTISQNEQNTQNVVSPQRLSLNSCQGQATEQIHFQQPFSPNKPIPHFKREAAGMHLQPVITSCPLIATNSISEQPLLSSSIDRNSNLRVVDSINMTDNNIFPQAHLQEPSNSPIQQQQLPSPVLSFSTFSPMSPLFQFSPNGTSGSFPFGSSGTVTPTFTPNGQDNRNVFK